MVLLFFDSYIQIIIFQFSSELSVDIMLIGLFVSIACQIGDIFFSYLKPNLRILKFLPGHGGILDRIDGIILGVPTGLIASKILLDFMFKKISILGSTGSIGLTTLNIIDKKKEFKVKFLSADKNYKLIVSKL